MSTHNIIFYNKIREKKKHLNCPSVFVFLRGKTFLATLFTFRTPNIHLCFLLSEYMSRNLVKRSLSLVIGKKI